MLQGCHIVDLEREPRRRNVVAVQRRRRASREAGRSIAEQFEMRWVSCPGIERCHLDHRTRDGIKLFLPPAAIERAPDDRKSQDLLVERDAWRRAGNWAIRMTEQELDELGEAISALLVPLQRRTYAGEAPPGSRLVDVLTYLMPRPGERGEQPDA